MLKRVFGAIGRAAKDLETERAGPAEPTI
jgi:hypothetical protein